MNTLTIISLLGSVIGGGIIVELFSIKKDKNIQHLLTFSGAYLLAISILHLIPEIFTHNTNDNIGIFILLGFLIQLLLEYFSQGIEHGHLHKSTTIPFSVLISLCLHALLEGVPLAGHLNGHAHNTLLSGIILHKLPVSIVLMSFFLQSNISKKKAYILLLIFAVMSPIGVLAGNLFIALASLQNEIMGIVAGIFIHISTTILFESSDGHKFNMYKIFAIVLATIITIFS